MPKWWPFKLVCRHSFHIDDLVMVNPESDGDDRVRWPCQKCGKVFNAQCGLDISPKHGPIENFRYEKEAPDAE